MAESAWRRESIGKITQSSKNDINDGNCHNVFSVYCMPSIMPNALQTRAI